MDEFKRIQVPEPPSSPGQSKTGELKISGNPSVIENALSVLESEANEMTNMWIPRTLLKELEDIKIIPREPAYSVVQRLFDEHSKSLKLRKRH